jgi:hypothetical protein
MLYKIRKGSEVAGCLGIIIALGIVAAGFGFAMGMRILF